MNISDPIMTACGDGGPSPSFFQSGTLSTCDSSTPTPYGVIFLVAIATLAITAIIMIIKAARRQKIPSQLFIVFFIAILAVVASLVWGFVIVGAPNGWYY